MVAVILTKSLDNAAVLLDHSNIASVEELRGLTFGAVVHLFSAVGVNSTGIQYDVKDILVLETAAEIAAIENKALREVFGAVGSVSVSVSPANDTSKATPEVGAVETGGDHKGQIYGGIFPDGKPGWISEEPKPMSHYEAVELKGRALTTGNKGNI